MDEETLQLNVQQILDELKRMQPDIEAEVQNEFGEDQQNLDQNQQGVWANVHMANRDNNAPEINAKARRAINANMQSQTDQLQQQMDTFIQRSKNKRVDFLVSKYMEDNTPEERHAVMDAVHQHLNPPVENTAEQVEEGPMPESKTEQTETEDTVDYDAINEATQSHGHENVSLHESFNAAAFEGKAPDARQTGFEA